LVWIQTIPAAAPQRFNRKQKPHHMPINRKLARIYTPEGQPGFLGPDHIARPVVAGSYSDTDPFIFLMDDLLDKKDTEPVGGPHPHAGFETVSLLLEGEVGDAAHKMKAGDFQIMTAGSGVVHTETIDTIARMRLLQLWVNLPKKDRQAAPRVQDLPLEHVPQHSSGGTTIRLYSGALAGLQSPVQNHVPMIIADITMEPGAATTLELPAGFNTFLYVLGGGLRVGADGQALGLDQVGWLDLHREEAASDLQLTAGAAGARFVLYGGRPAGEPFISQGPFIADSSEDIARLYRDYRQGKMQHISTVPDSRRIRL
jgi:redox-sensitive bicupin YhaK (pirin superfamily)